MNNVIVILEIQRFRNQSWVNATEHTFSDNCGLVRVLGSERLATDPDDRDLTGTMRLLGLESAIAPAEWPHGHDRPALQMLFQSFAPIRY